MNSFTFLRKKHRTRTNLLAAFSVLAPLISQAQTPDTLMAVKDNSQNHRMSLYKNGGFLLGGEYTGTGGSIVAEVQAHVYYGILKKRLSVLAMQVVHNGITLM